MRGKSLKTAGLLLFLVLLIVLAIRLALTALETQSVAGGDPNGQIRKVEKEMKQLSEKKSAEIQSVSEAEEKPSAPPE